MAFVRRPAPEPATLFRNPWVLNMKPARDGSLGTGMAWELIVAPPKVASGLPLYVNSNLKYRLAENSGAAGRVFAWAGWRVISAMESSSSLETHAKG